MVAAAPAHAERESSPNHLSSPSAIRSHAAAAVAPVSLVWIIALEHRTLALHPVIAAAQQPTVVTESAGMGSLPLETIRHRVGQAMGFTVFFARLGFGGPEVL